MMKWKQTQTQTVTPPPAVSPEAVCVPNPAYFPSQAQGGSCGEAASGFFRGSPNLQGSLFGWMHRQVDREVMAGTWAAAGPCCAIAPCMPVLASHLPMTQAYGSCFLGSRACSAARSARTCL